MKTVLQKRMVVFAEVDRSLEQKKNKPRKHACILKSSDANTEWNSIGPMCFESGDSLLSEPASIDANDALH